LCGARALALQVTNQVFRYAKKCGASYINKPKMRHYVHCYALHCLDEEASNALRRAYKARGENVGAWRQACYAPLVDIAARHGFDIDAVFAAHPRLAIWYVPTRLRQLCHQARGSHAHAHAAAPDVLAASSMSACTVAVRVTFASGSSVARSRNGRVRAFSASDDVMLSLDCCVVLVSQEWA
jgi:hypothetical protein